MYQIRKSDPKPHRSLLLLIGLIILVTAVTFVALEASNTTHFFHKNTDPEKTKTPTTGGGSSFIDKGTTQKPRTSSGSQTTDGNTTSKDTGNAGTATLLEPTGNFVSAHKVPNNAQLTSVCNTTPGATCTIIFTKDGVQKSLPIQTTDSGGSTFWSAWTPKSIGITSGTWTIEAKASLDGMQKTAKDAMNLEVTQ